jgi:hypothetical protein
VSLVWRWRRSWKGLFRGDAIHISPSSKTPPSKSYWSLQAISISSVTRRLAVNRCLGPGPRHQGNLLASLNTKPPSHTGGPLKIPLFRLHSPLTHVHTTRIFCAQLSSSQTIVTSQALFLQSKECKPGDRSSLQIGSSADIHILW